MDETRTNEFKTGDAARDKSRARTIDDPAAVDPLATSEVTDRTNKTEVSRSSEAVTDFEVAADQPANFVVERKTEVVTPVSPPGGWKTEDNDVDATRAEIERTRAGMSQTIDQIQEKLNPQLLLDQAKDAASDFAAQTTETMKEKASEFVQQTKENLKDATIGRAQEAVGNAVDSTKDFVSDAGHAARDMGYTALDTVQENPIPFAVAGLGLGWLLWSYLGRRTPQPRFRHGRYVYRGRVYDFVNTADDRPGPSSYSSAPARGYARASQPAGEYNTNMDGSGVMDRAGQFAGRIQDKTGDMVNQVQDSAGRMVDQVQDKAGRMVDQVQDQASQLGRQAQDQFQHASVGFQRMLEDSPLAVGAIALAVGVAVGLAVPETDHENRLMGETRDNLIDTAQQTAQNVAHNVAQKVQNVASEAVDAAKEEAKNQGLAGKVADVAGAATNAAKTEATKPL